MRSNFAKLAVAIAAVAVLLAVAFWLFLPTATPDAPTDSAPSASDSPVRRIYDMKDILASGSGLPTTRSIGNSATAALNLAGVAKLIEDRIDPASWHKPGVVLDSSHNRLIITQTPENQRQIAKLIDQLRPAKVVLNARFLSLDPPAIESLPAALRDAIGKSKSQGVVFLSPGQLDEFLNIVLRRNNTASRSVPLSRLQNGQSCEASTVQATSYVKSLTLSPNKSAYTPVIDEARTGLIVTIWASVSADRKNITLDLDLSDSRLVRMEIIPFVARDGTRPGSVQSPIIHSNRVQTRVTVPEGSAMLMPFAMPEADPNQTSYFLVTPQVISPSKGGDTHAPF